MNTFNRFFAMLVCVGTIIFWCLLMLVVWMLPADLGNLFTQLGRAFRLSPLMLQVLVSGLAVSTVLLCLLVLVGEFTSQRGGTLRIRREGGRVAEISTENVAARLRSTLADIEDLASARPLIRVAGADSVDVLVEAQARPGAHLPTLADEITRRVQEGVSVDMGVGLRGVRVAFLEATPGNLADRSDRPLDLSPSGEIVVPSAVAAAATPPTQDPTAP